MTGVVCLSRPGAPAGLASRMFPTTRIAPWRKGPARDRLEVSRAPPSRAQALDLNAGFRRSLVRFQRCLFSWAPFLRDGGPGSLPALRGAGGFGGWSEESSAALGTGYAQPEKQDLTVSLAPLGTGYAQPGSASLAGRAGSGQALSGVDLTPFGPSLRRLAAPRLAVFGPSGGREETSVSVRDPSLRSGQATRSRRSRI